tara:strand:- start:1352 stop:1489 length:138 start_codon:yes stop_codon:yes gene_type:complete
MIVNINANDLHLESIKDMIASQVELNAFFGIWLFVVLIIRKTFWG